MEKVAVADFHDVSNVNRSVVAMSAYSAGELPTCRLAQGDPVLRLHSKHDDGSAGIIGPCLGQGSGHDLTECSGTQMPGGPGSGHNVVEGFFRRARQDEDR